MKMFLNGYVLCRKVNVVLHRRTAVLLVNYTCPPESIFVKNCKHSRTIMVQIEVPCVLAKAHLCGQARAIPLSASPKT
jgi:hypothetical protein